MTYIIKRDGEAVGSIDDDLLAEQIDGLEIHNDASDPAYEHVYTYTIEEA